MQRVSRYWTPNGIAPTHRKGVVKHHPVYRSDAKHIGAEGLQKMEDPIASDEPAIYGIFPWIDF